LFATCSDLSAPDLDVGSLHESSTIIIEREISAEAEHTDHQYEQGQYWADDLQDMLDDYD
jgi:hypothetical protein